MDKHVRSISTRPWSTFAALMLVAALLASCAPATPSQSAQPSPAASITPAPSANPTPVPSATPAPSSSPSPTPSPTPSSSPSPSPALSSPATSVNLTQTYLLKVKLDFAAHRLDVIETLTVTNRSQAPINYLNLSVIPTALGYYQAQGQAKVNGIPVKAVFTNHTNLRVPFAADLAPGASATVIVPFRLNVGTSTGAFGTRTTIAGGILNLGEWFPIVSVLHDSYGLGDPQVSYAATYTLDLTAVGSFGRNALAAPGVLRSFSNGNHWVYTIANARDYAFAFSPSFKLVRTSVNGVSVELYSLVTESGALSQMSAALAQYDRTYGPYPWSRFVMAQTGAAGFSMEFPGIVLMGRDMFNAYVIWHETGHQWFYGQVGNNQMTDPLVDESLVEFSARYFLHMSLTSCSSVPVNEPVTHWKAGLTTGSWFGCGGYFETIYHRGAQFLNQIRLAMGNTRFFAALKAFVVAHQFGLVTETDLLRALNSADGGKLGPIFRAYLTASGAAAALR